MREEVVADMLKPVLRSWCLEWVGRSRPGVKGQLDW